MISKIIGYIIAILYILIMAPCVFFSYLIVGAIFEIYFLFKNAIKQVKRTKVEAELYLEEFEKHFHENF
jgi:uncharacterized MnhB-related membrane protein